MKTLGFIGMGNMAGAIAAGILQKGLMKKEEELTIEELSKRFEKADKILEEKYIAVFFLNQRCD